MANISLLGIRAKLQAAIKQQRAPGLQCRKECLNIKSDFQVMQNIQVMTLA